jgi:hypothetical protein
LETNGTLLSSSDKNLYNVLKSTNGRVSINIGLHNISWRDKMIKFAIEFLEGPIYQHSFKSFEVSFIESYNNIKADVWPDCKTLGDWQKLDNTIKKECETLFNLNPDTLRQKGVDEELTNQARVSLGDKNGVQVNIALENEFYQSPVIHDLEHETLTLHNNDVIKSHTHCMERGDCFQLIDGSIFKCHVALTLPHFERQFPMNISQDDKKIIHSYESANLSMSDSDLEEWFNKLKNPISMCKFCSIDPVLHRFSAEQKKVFFVKKKKLD